MSSSVWVTFDWRHSKWGEVVTDANFRCYKEGINFQAMDNSHVALVAVQLEAALDQIVVRDLCLQVLTSHCSSMCQG